MKRTLLSIAVLCITTILLSSCVKEYTCVCETFENKGGTKVRADMTTVKVFGKNKEEVRATCDKKEDFGGGRTFECRLN